MSATVAVVIPEAIVEWTSLEKLALVSAVVKKGHNNWPTVSRLVRPYISPSKNIELFSPKNCALKYDHLVEQLDKERKKKDATSEAVAVRTQEGRKKDATSEAVAEQVLQQVTAERISELKEKVKKLHANCTQLHVELNEVNSGKYTTHIEVAWDEVQKRKHSQDFHPLSTLVASILNERKVKEEPKSSTKIKEEVLDEGHSSTSSASNKSDKKSTAEARTSLQVNTNNPAPAAQHASGGGGSTPGSIPSRSPVGTSPSRGPRLVASPRLPGNSRIVNTKTKHPADPDKSKIKTIKPQKKKPVVPKIKIKALQMANNSDPKGVTKGDKKETKITDVFHFDYQPPSGSGTNPNAQYSSLYQESAKGQPPVYNVDKQENRSESYENSPASSITTHTMSPRIDLDTLDLDSASYRAWKKSILLLWKTAAQHKYAQIFMHPVTDELAPGYSSTVRRPIDLTTIKRKIDSNDIRTTAQFHRDMLLMFHNALMYNNASHSVYSCTVSMMVDVVDVIQAFYASHNQLPDKHLQKGNTRSRGASVTSQ